MVYDIFITVSVVLENTSASVYNVFVIKVLSDYFKNSSWVTRLQMAACDWYVFWIKLKK